MLRPQSRRDIPIAACRWFRALAGLATALWLTISAGPVAAQSASQIAKLNKQALEAYDGLNFDQARTYLEEALAVAKREGLENDPSNARTHLNLGMLLIAGLQKPDEGREHFRAALKIQPDISPPVGLFNPEVQTVFDEVKAQAEADAAAARATAASSRPARTAAVEDEGDEEDSAADEETEPAPDDSDLAGRFVVSLVGGSGGGVVKGPLEVNTDIAGRAFDWPGAFALSKAGHLTLSAGYFVSPSLLISLEGRYQFVQGTKTVWYPMQCQAGCTPPSSAIAGVARASWFFGSAPFRWFMSGGLGAGRIRHVVPVKVVESGTEHNDCGDKMPMNRMGEKCVDTVAGGPLLVSPGLGFSYDLGPVFVLGVANLYVGVPTAMFHLDLNVGLGLRI